MTEALDLSKRKGGGTIICIVCQQSVQGQFKDNPELLAEAIKYLGESHG